MSLWLFHPFIGVSMSALELADELEYWFGNAGFAEHVAMLRQQQAEIEFLKKEILAKHEDWKHEGQQAANAKAEIEALKADKLEYAEEVLEALNWGNYAGDYFQQKHGWYDDVAKWNGVVELLRKASEK